MWRTICKLLFRLSGWKAIKGVIPHKKAIIIGVPHTSGWDFVLSCLEEDIRPIKAFYREYAPVARHPEKFSAED